MSGLVSGSVRNKLLISIAIPALLVIAVISWGFYTTHINNARLQHVITDDLAFKSAVQNLSTDFKTEVQSWKNVLLRGEDDKQLTKYWNQVKQSHSNIQQQAEQMIQELTQVHKDPETAALMMEFVAKHRRMLQVYKKARDEFVARDFDYRAADRIAIGIDKEPASILDQVVKVMDDETQIPMRNAIKAFKQGQKIAIIGMIIAIAASFVIILFLIQKSIIRPASHMVRELGRMADGDFTGNITVSSDDEIGQIAASAERLRRILVTSCSRSIRRPSSCPLRPKKCLTSQINPVRL